VSRDNEVIDDSGCDEITDAAPIVFESEALVNAEISPEDVRVHVAMRVSSTVDCNLQPVILCDMKGADSFHRVNARFHDNIQI
jgi:hypothetical protein